MANYDHLPVYKAAYDLLQCIYREMGHVPRDVKFTLVETLKNELMEMIVLIYKANVTTDKCRHIEAARELTVSTKVRLRLLYDLHHISVRLYARMSEQAENLSKQLAAWHGYATRKNGPESAGYSIQRGSAECVR
ncbi:MAG: four helix bundle protein [Bacteroides heparinolyticus]|nr:four helix bundle protein [Bacteroides heparinolyticus]